MNINTLDLNLLRVLHAVMQEGNITVAGARLGLTQPTMSNALRRLRALFNDPLFVRTTHGMKPTPYAETLAGPVSETMATIRKLLELDQRFDPANTSRIFSIVMTDIGELMFLPRLMAHLEIAAPGANVISAQIPRERYREALESGSADIAIGQLPEVHQDFHQQMLCEEPLVCLMRREHPEIGNSLSLEQFLAARHIVVVHSSQGDSWVRKALGKHADKRRIVLQVPHYVVLPAILAETNLISVIPRAAANAFRGLPTLKALPLPFRVPGIQVRQFWHARSHHDQGHRWFRNVMAQLFSGAPVDHS